MIDFDLLNIRTFLYFQNRFIAFELELLTWLLIHFWCNKSWLWFRFNTCHVSFGFLIFYYTINLSPWTLFQHSIETSQFYFNIDELMPMSMQKIPKIRLNFYWTFIWSDIDVGDNVIMVWHHWCLYGGDWFQLWVKKSLCWRLFPCTFIFENKNL